MRKVCVVVTARPSYSRIKTVLREIKRSAELELQLVIAASALLDRYGSVVDQVEADGFEIASRVFMVLEGENPLSMAKTTGIGVMELATAFENLKPDAVVTVADRYETLATAIAAAYTNIPLVHIQGGEVTGSIDEKVRHAVTKLADIHFPSTALAAERLIRMGESEDVVFTTGCPSIDIAAELPKTDFLSFDPVKQYGGVGQTGLDLSGGYVVAMQHPVTTEYRESREQIEVTLEATQRLDRPVLWFWPNVDAGSDGTSSGIRAFREAGKDENMRFFKNMAGNDFLELLVHSSGIVGNSSVGIRECSFLGVPTVNIGGRQSRRERGKNVIDTAHDVAEIEQAIRRQITHGRYASEPIYGDGRAGSRIASLLSEVPLRVTKQLTY